MSAALSPREPSRGETQKVVLAGSLIVAAGLAAYSSQWGGAFVMDDRPSILKNASIRHLTDWGRVLTPAHQGLTVSGRPLVNLSLALNYAWGGLNPWGYHCFNLAIHLLAGLVLFGLVRRTVAHVAPERSLWVGWGVALLWTLHPLQTESVTYVIQRAEAMMGLCYLLTFYGFVRYAERPTALWAGFSFLVCLCGMACKEVMVSAPVLVLLYDRIFWSGSFRAAWRERRYFYVGLAATWALLLGLVLGAGNRGGTSGFGVGAAAGPYWLAQIPALGRYLRLALWPSPLIFDYGLDWPRAAGTFALAALAVGGVAIATIVGWVHVLRRSASARSASALIAFAGIWFFALLAPTSLVPGNRQVMAEHRMYLSLAAVLLVLVLVLGAVLRWRRGPLTAVILLWAAALGILTHRRNRDYASEVTLYRDAVAKFPGNYFTRSGLGAALFDAGDLEGARVQYEKALQLNPNFGEADNNLGLYYYRLGDFAQASEFYRAALRQEPHDADVHNNYGVALFHLGDAAGAQAQYALALAEDPGSAVTYINLGTLAQQQGQPEPALADFRQALRLDPDSVEATDDLGIALVGADRLPEALDCFARAVRLKPDFAKGHYDLGLALLRAGRPADAVGPLVTAIRLQPDFAAAHYNLGLAYRGLGRSDQAEEEIATARRQQAAAP